MARWRNLCRTYWFPLYAYVRRRGHTKEDAEDLTQAFFARFLAKNYLAGLSAERGRFRAFLLASLKHFLVNEWKKSQRQKRGGGETPLSLDWQTADTKFQVAATNEPSPDKAFDREWALALLAKVIERLQKGMRGRRQGEAVRAVENFSHGRARTKRRKRKRPRRWAWRKARCAWRFIACGSVTGNCSATKSRRRWPTPRTWTRKCARCSARFQRNF